MLSLPPSVRVFVAREATDMRKHLDTLAVLVMDEERQSGHLFLFINRGKVSHHRLGANYMEGCNERFGLTCSHTLSH